MCKVFFVGIACVDGGFVMLRWLWGLDRIWRVSRAGGCGYANTPDLQVREIGGTRPLAQHRSNCLTKRSLVPGLQCAQLLEQETLFERGEDRLDRRGLQQVGCLPLDDPNLTQAGKRTKLTGDCHDDGIRPGCVVARLLTTTAGRCLNAAWLVKGNRTSTTSPNS